MSGSGTRPAGLGGGNQAHSGTGLTEATFIEAYQDPQTLQWRCRVELDGGKVRENVGFGFPGSRVTVGSRPVLPARGERGLVAWPSSERQIKNGYWLCSVDIYTYGPHTDHPDEARELHPSARGSATDKDGNRATYYPNGDRILENSGLETQGSAPELLYRPHPQTRAKRLPFTGFNAGRSSQWFYHGEVNGRVFGARLGCPLGLEGGKATSTGGASGQMLLNNFASTASTSLQRTQGPASTDAGVHLRAATIPAEADVETLHAQPGDTGVARTHHSSAGLLTLEARKFPGYNATMRLDGNIGVIELIVEQLIALKSEVIQLRAERVAVGAGDSAVAMARNTDLNFEVLATMLGLSGAMLPTASANLFAEGVTP